MIWQWWQISDVHGNVVHTDKRFMLKLKGKVYTIIDVIYVYVLCEKLSLYVILVRGVLVYDLQYRVSFNWYSIIVPVIIVPAGHVTAATRTDPLYSQGACKNDCFRPPTTQSLIGQYPAQVVTFSRLDHPPPQRLATSGNVQHSITLCMYDMLHCRSSIDIVVDVTK